MNDQKPGWHGSPRHGRAHATCNQRDGGHSVMNDKGNLHDIDIECLQSQI